MTRKASESPEIAREGTKRVVAMVTPVIGENHWRITGDPLSYALERRPVKGKNPRWVPIAWYVTLTRALEALPQLAPRHGGAPRGDKGEAHRRDLIRAMHEMERLKGETREALKLGESQL